MEVKNHGGGGEGYHSGGVKRFNKPCGHFKPSQGLGGGFNGLQTSGGTRGINKGKEEL